MARKSLLNSKESNSITDILESLELLLEASVCIHDFYLHALLPSYWYQHHGCDCLPFRNKNFEKCKNFYLWDIRKKLSTNDSGCCFTCPFGIDEIAAPIICEGAYTGILFAGSFKNLPQAKEDRIKHIKASLEILRCASNRIGTILGRSFSTEDSNMQKRQRVIIDWVSENMDRSPPLTELAERLCLSPSRTSVVVNKLFNMSLTELIQSIKLNTAAYWLNNSEKSVGEISLQLGYCDQAYFSRLFSRKFGVSPIKFRKDPR